MTRRILYLAAAALGLCIWREWAFAPAPSYRNPRQVCGDGQTDDVAVARFERTTAVQPDLKLWSEGNHSGTACRAD